MANLTMIEDGGRGPPDNDGALRPPNSSDDDR
jgi:hypothetical protein